MLRIAFLCFVSVCPLPVPLGDVLRYVVCELDGVVSRLISIPLEDVHRSTFLGDKLDNLVNDMELTLFRDR